MARLPTAINLHKASKTLTLTYAPGEAYNLPAEFLRVHSPSAEVQGHGNPILQFGKINVGLVGLEPAGQYALKLTSTTAMTAACSPGSTSNSCACARNSCGPSTSTNCTRPGNPATRPNRW